MERKRAIARYRGWYARLVGLYPKPYRERFGEGMEQTFADLLRERADEGAGLAGGALWMFAETSAGIIRQNLHHITMFNKRILFIVLGVAVILTIPAVAMQFTSEVQWTGSDFAVAAALLLAAGLGFEFVSRKFASSSYKWATALAAGTALFLVWANGAVGLIGDEGQPVNSLFLLVPFVGVVGAFIAGFRPLGMSRALYATAVAQMLVPVAGLVIWKPQIDVAQVWSLGEGSSVSLGGVIGAFAIAAFFAAFFAGAGFLYKRSAGAIEE